MKSGFQLVTKISSGVQVRICADHSISSTQPWDKPCLHGAQELRGTGEIAYTGYTVILDWCVGQGVNKLLVRPLNLRLRTKHVYKATLYALPQEH